MKFVNWVRSESAAITGFVMVAMNLVIAFGLTLSADQIAAINAVVAAALAFFVRSQSQPSNAVKVAQKA